MTISIQQHVDDFTFLRPDGSSLKMSEIGARFLVLTFLRHLA